VIYCTAWSLSRYDGPARHTTPCHAAHRPRRRPTRTERRPRASASPRGADRRRPPERSWRPNSTRSTAPWARGLSFEKHNLALPPRSAIIEGAAPRPGGSRFSLSRFRRGTPTPRVGKTIFSMHPPSPTVRCPDCFSLSSSARGFSALPLPLVQPRLQLTVFRCASPQ
jgi:hypothetical protein